MNYSKRINDAKSKIKVIYLSFEFNETFAHIPFNAPKLMLIKNSRLKYKHFILPCVFFYV